MLIAFSFVWQTINLHISWDVQNKNFIFESLAIRSLHSQDVLRHPAQHLFVKFWRCVRLLRSQKLLLVFERLWEIYFCIFRSIACEAIQLLNLQGNFVKIANIYFVLKQTHCLWDNRGNNPAWLVLYMTHLHPWISTKRSE